MSKRYHFTLTDAERETLDQMTREGKADAGAFRWAGTLLKSDEAEGWVDEGIARAFGVSARKGERARPEFVERGPRPRRLSLDLTPQDRLLAYDDTMNLSQGRNPIAGLKPDLVAKVPGLSGDFVRGQGPRRSAEASACSESRCAPVMMALESVGSDRFDDSPMLYESDPGGCVRWHIDGFRFCCGSRSRAWAWRVSGRTRRRRTSC